MDDNVGKVLSTLKENGLEENTLVIFTNDNGGPQGTGTSNYPLKGHKGNLYEGGVRVPWAMSWPSVIPPGSVIDDPISTLDILPTVFDAADQPIDPNWGLDGRSMLPLLKDPQASMPDRALYWRRKGVEGPIAIRYQDWKIREASGPDRSRPELYNLAVDVGEAHNVASEHPEVVARLMAMLNAWESELATPLWGPGNPGFTPQ
jgi:arylsulfatase A-like enzyme